MPYNGSIKLISGIVQASGGNFPLVHDSAVQVGENKNYRLNNALDEILTNKQDRILVEIVDELPQLDQLPQQARNTIYMIPNESHTGYAKWWLIEYEDENDLDQNQQPIVKLKWDVFGGSLVEIVNQLPLIGDSSTDYYLFKGKSSSNNSGNEEPEQNNEEENSGEGSEEEPVDNGEEEEASDESFDEGIYLHYRYINSSWQLVGGAPVEIGQLPSVGNQFVDYYVPNNDNVYLHYRYIENNWELIGSDSYSKAQMDVKIDELQGADNATGARITTVQQEVASRISSLNDDIGALQDTVYSLDYDDDEYVLHLKKAVGDEQSQSISDVYIAGGGGDAAAGSLTLQRAGSTTAPSMSVLFNTDDDHESNPIFIYFTWSCVQIDTEDPTGNGTMHVFHSVGKAGTFKQIFKETIAQGVVHSINIAPYLVGQTENGIKIQVIDNDTGARKNVSWTITPVSFKIESSFDKISHYYQGNKNLVFDYNLKTTGISSLINMHYVIGKVPRQDVTGGPDCSDAVIINDGIPSINNDNDSGLIRHFEESKINVVGLSSSYVIQLEDLLNEEGEGPYSLDVYAQTNIDIQGQSTTIYSNILHYEFIYAYEGSTQIFVMSSFNKKIVNQGETVNIPFIIYNPGYSSTYYDTGTFDSTFQLQVYDVTDNKSWDSQHNRPDYPRYIRPDNSEQIWNFVPTEAHEYILTIVGGSVANYKKIFLQAEASNITFSEITDKLFAKFTTEGKSNTDTKFNVWESIATGEDVYSGSFNFPDDFDWVNGGWQLANDYEDNNPKVLTIKASSNKVILPLELFGKDNANNDIWKQGRSIKLIFKAKNCIDYETSLISCYQGDDSNQQIDVLDEHGEPMYDDHDNKITTTYRTGKGLKIYANRLIFDTQNQKIEMPFSEGSKIEMDIVVTTPQLEDSRDRYILIYLNGILSNAYLYDTSDSFEHSTNNQNLRPYIQFGSEKCDLDLYLFKIYNKALSKIEILHNFVMDSGNYKERKARFDRNNILTNLGGINYNSNNFKTPYIIAKLTDDDGPYTYVFHGAKMKNSTCYGDLQYVDPTDSNNNWTCTDVHIGMQGTSSAGYGPAGYNLDFDLNNEGKAKIRDSNGNLISGIKIDENSFPVDYLNLKVDIASSESANNVLLTRDYNDFDPYISDPQLDNLEQQADEKNDIGYKDFNPIRPSKTPESELEQGQYYQTKDERDREINYFNTNGYKTQVRGTIAGKPIVIFYQLKGSNQINFYAKANLNNSKKNFEVFGENSEKYPNQMCIEFLSNESGYCNFLPVNEDPNYDFEHSSNWATGLEFRYPQKGYDAPGTDYLSNLQRVFRWVKDTNTDYATNEPLANTVTLDGQNYTHDTAEYRLAKFKDEINDYFILDSLIWFYLFTEVHLMVDSRAKNVFMTTDDGLHWHFKNNYDDDTALGIDNNGRLKHGYDVEYKDDNRAYGGESSVLWINLERKFQNEIRDMYNRMSNAWNPQKLIEKFKEHQGTWPEAVWNEDMFKKYIRPYEQYGDASYFNKLLGNKQLQRSWFLKYRNIYMSSKYDHSASMDDQIEFRLMLDQGQQNASIKIVPYINMYINVRQGGNDTTGLNASQHQKALKGKECNVIINGAEGESGSAGQETYIHHASVILEVKNLSQFNPTRFNASKATRLTKLILGDNNHYNNSWPPDETLSINSVLMEEINIANMSIPGAINLSNITGLKKFYANGSSITSVTFAKNSLLQQITLPNTITKLDIELARNLKTLQIQTNQNGKYPYLTEIIIDKTPPHNEKEIQSMSSENNIDQKIIDIILNCSQATNKIAVRLIDMYWTLNKETSNQLYNKLKNIRGIDNNGNVQSVLKQCITGITRYESIVESELQNWINLLSISQQNNNSTKYMRFLSASNNTMYYTLTYKNNDEIYYQEDILQGESGHNLNQIYAAAGGPPTKDPDVESTYTFNKWVDENGYDWNVDNIQTNMTFYAQYNQSPREYNVYYYEGVDYSTVISDENYQTLPAPTGTWSEQTAGLSFTGLLTQENNYQHNHSGTYTCGWTIVTAEGQDLAYNGLTKSDFIQLPYYSAEQISNLRGTTWCFLQKYAETAPGDKSFNSCSLGEIKYALHNNSFGSNWQVGDTKTFELNPDENNNHISIDLAIANINNEDHTIDLIMNSLTPKGYYYNKHKKSVDCYSVKNATESTDRSGLQLNQRKFTASTSSLIIEVTPGKENGEDYDQGHPLITNIKIGNTTYNAEAILNNNTFNHNGEIILDQNDSNNKFIEMMPGSTITFNCSTSSEIIITTYLNSGFSWNNGGWYMSDLRASANNDFYNLLPIGLKRMIIPKERKNSIGNYLTTTVYTYNSNTNDYDIIQGSGNSTELYLISKDKIWIPNNNEVYFGASNNIFPTIYSGEGGSISSIFTTDESRQRNYSTYDDFAKNKKCKMYFLSTTYAEYNNSVGAVDENGKWHEGLAAYSILPCVFCMTLGQE